MRLGRDDRQSRAPPPRHEFAFDAAVYGLAFLPDGTLATGLGDGSVRLIAPAETASPKIRQPHCEGAAVHGVGYRRRRRSDRAAMMVVWHEQTRAAKSRYLRSSGPESRCPGREPHDRVAPLAAGREVRLIGRGGETRASADHPSTVPDAPSTQKGSGSAYLTVARRHFAGRASSTREPRSLNGMARISASHGARTARRC